MLVCDKPDSQDICFVPDGDYASVVKKIKPEAEKVGNIIDLQGNVLGQHKGIIHYTIGQRRGLGLGGGINDDNAPFYVVRVDADKNEVIVGKKEALARDIIHISECNWLMQDTDKENIEIMVKLRSVTPPAPATLEINDAGQATITLKTPQYGIAPGQAAVCYAGDRLIGGGWITRTNNTQMPIAA